MVRTANRGRGLFTQYRTCVQPEAAVKYRMLLDAMYFAVDDAKLFY